MNSKNGDDSQADSPAAEPPRPKTRKNQSVYYLGLQDIVNINNEVTGGDPRIRDVHLLYSALRRPAMVLFGQPQFPTVFDKAAALMESLAYHHLFADGNKRTAVLAVALFLERNNYTFTYDAERDYAYILEIAQGQHDTEAIAHWLEERALRR